MLMPTVGDKFCLPGDSYGWSEIREVIRPLTETRWLVRGSLTEQAWIIESHIVNNQPTWEALDCFVCTAAVPFTPDKTRLYDRIAHPDFECVDETFDWYDGDSDEIHVCPHCGTRYKVYIPR